MNYNPGLHFINALDIEGIRADSLRDASPVYVLPRDIVDQATFFEAIRRTLPLDPPLLGNASWDGLADSLWEGLRDSTAKEVLILWPNADALAIRSKEAFDTVILVLEDVVATIGDAGATNGAPTALAVLIESSCPEPRRKK